jgi:PAS domain S-box-containing protein
VFASLVRDQHKQALYFVTVVEDITQRRQVQEKLRESEERFRNMADAAPVMIWVSGPDKGCTFFNKVWLDFTGRTMEQELGDGWAEGVHPDDRDRCLTIYSSSFEARQSFRMEYRLRRVDGEYRWLLDNGVPRFAPGGVFEGYIGSCIDITERKHEEGLREELRRERERLAEARGMERGVDPKGETTREATPCRSMISAFDSLVQSFMMPLSAKRRRAMLASTPIEE